MLYRTIISIISFAFIWDSWILHLYVGGKYAYLPLSLFSLMEYFYHKNVSPGHHGQNGDVDHSPLQFPSQENHLTTIYRQDIIVKTPRTQWWVWSLSHPGPQKLRKITIEGKRSSCAPSTSPFTQAGTNVTQKVPLWAYGFSSWKERPQVNIQFLSTAGHFLGRLAGSRLKWITRLSRWFMAWVSGRDPEGGWGFQQSALISWQTAFLLRRSTWAESSSQWLRPYAELSLLWPGSSAGSSA